MAAGRRLDGRDGPYPRRNTPRIADAHWVAQTADRVLAAMEETRSTWQMWHVRAEAQRHVRTVDVPAEQANTLVDLLVDEVLEHRSVALAAPPDGIEEPGALRRVDGSSVYTIAGADLYTSQRILDAEQRLLTVAGTATERSSTAPLSILPCWRWPRTAPPWILGKPPWSGRCAPLVRDYSSRSPRRRREDHRHARPDPSLDRRGRPGHRPRPIRCRGCRPRRANRHSHRHFGQTHLVARNGGLPDWATGVGPSTLIIIDEAGMADTLSLDTAVRFAIDRGASVRLIGDDQQLAAIGAGGVLRDIKNIHGAVQLTELHRFTDPAEAQASLTLREGDPSAFGFYLDHGRVHVGDLAKITEEAFAAWVSDRSAGLDAIMLAPTRELVADSTAEPVIIVATGLRPGKKCVWGTETRPASAT